MYCRTVAGKHKFECLMGAADPPFVHALKFQPVTGARLRDHPQEVVELWSNVMRHVDDYFAK